jgi:hypothetical protein
MGWLLGQTWPWMLLTALLGVVITILLTIRKLEIVTVRERTAAPAPEPGPPASEVPAVEQPEAQPELEEVEPAVASEAEPETGPAPSGPDDSASTFAGVYPGSAAPTDNGSAPPGYDIKGHDRTGLYHTTESPYYGRIRAEVWFDNEDSARAAGFTRWDQRPSDDDDAPSAERPPEPEPEREADPGPEATQDLINGPGSAAPLDDGTAPDGFRIKGNADTMLFHTEESPYYGRTRAEVWFSSEEAARAAGFIRWDED